MTRNEKNKTDPRRKWIRKAKKERKVENGVGICENGQRKWIQSVPKPWEPVREGSEPAQKGLNQPKGKKGTEPD